jgi:phage tail-like protein
MTDLIGSDPALSVYFTVEVDGFDIGSWTTCSGLGMEIETVNRGDTAMSFVVHHLPGQMKYTNLVLGRPVSPDTSRVIAWINAFHMLPLPTSAQVTALDSTQGVIVTWQLLGVTPVKWTGPSFDASRLALANEQLELAYQAFG